MSGDAFFGGIDWGKFPTQVAPPDYTYKLKIESIERKETKGSDKPNSLPPGTLGAQVTASIVEPAEVGGVPVVGMRARRWFTLGRADDTQCEKLFAAKTKAERERLTSTGMAEFNHFRSNVLGLKSDADTQSAIGREFYGVVKTKESGDFTNTNFGTSKSLKEGKAGPLNGAQPLAQVGKPNVKTADKQAKVETKKAATCNNCGKSIPFKDFEKHAATCKAEEE